MSGVIAPWPDRQSDPTTAMTRPFAHVAWILALFAPVPAHVVAEDEQIDARRRDLVELEHRVVTLEEHLDARRSDRALLVAELQWRERDVADAARAAHELDALHGEQERALRELNARLEVERVSLRGERAILARLLRSAYALGRGDRIRMLLDQEDVPRLSRISAYYGYLNRYRARRIEAVAASAHRVEGLLRETAQEGERLAVLAARQEETRRRLVQAQAQRAELLSNLERAITSEAERLADLQADAQGLRHLLDQLERQALALPEADVVEQPIERSRGRLPWPIQGGRMESRFGQPKGDDGQLWDGVVIAAAEGSQVRAVHHGRVAYADWLRGFGQLVIVEHDDGYMTLYGHNQTLLKEAGEWVAAGDLLALSGTSGGQHSAGLYFAIRHRGRPLDPALWCRAWG